MLKCISTAPARTKCVSAFSAHSGARHFFCKLRGYAPCRRPLGESEVGTLRVPAVNIFHSDGGRRPVKVALRSLMAQACRSRRRQHGLQTFMEFERNQKIGNSQGQAIKEGVLTDLCMGPTGNQFTVYVATPKQQGPEGRTGPAGHGLHCLTLLSEPTRKLAV